MPIDIFNDILNHPFLAGSIVLFILCGFVLLITCLLD